MNRDTSLSCQFRHIRVCPDFSGDITLDFRSLSRTRAGDPIPEDSQDCGAKRVWIHVTCGIRTTLASRVSGCRSFPAPFLQKLHLWPRTVWAFADEGCEGTLPHLHRFLIRPHEGRDPAVRELAGPSAAAVIPQRLKVLSQRIAFERPQVAFRKILQPNSRELRRCGNPTLRNLAPSISGIRTFPYLSPLFLSAREWIDWSRILQYTREMGSRAKTDPQVLRRIPISFASIPSVSPQDIRPVGP